MRALRWALFALLLLGFILLPFALLEDTMNAWVQQHLVQGAGGWWAVMGLVVLLLLADIALPVPSSLVLAAAGHLLGAASGSVVAFVGLSLASLAGYALGRWGAEPLAQRLVGEASLAQFGERMRRYGGWLLVAVHAVPVLAEASSILAGMAGMPLRRYLLFSSLGNAVVALLFAGIGAWATQPSSFLLLSLAAMALPLALAALLTRR